MAFEIPIRYPQAWNEISRCHQTAMVRSASKKRGGATMGIIEDKLRAMGHSLPEPFAFPNPNRIGCVVVGSIIYVSGHGQNLSGPGIKAKGKLGHDVTAEEGYATSRGVALAMLSSLKKELGELDRVARVIRLFCMANVAPGAERLPYVMDGASDLFYELFGPKAGQHARTVLGVADLPNGIAVEINGEFELKA